MRSIIDIIITCACLIGILVVWKRGTRMKVVQSWFRPLVAHLPHSRLRARNLAALLLMISLIHFKTLAALTYGTPIGKWFLFLILFPTFTIILTALSLLLHPILGFLDRRRTTWASDLTLLFLCLAGLFSFVHSLYYQGGVFVVYLYYVFLNAFAILYVARMFSREWDVLEREFRRRYRG